MTRALKGSGPASWCGAATQSGPRPLEAMAVGITLDLGRSRSIGQHVLYARIADRFPTRVAAPLAPLEIAPLLEESAGEAQPVLVAGVTGGRGADHLDSLDQGTSATFCAVNRRPLPAILVGDVGGDSQRFFDILIRSFCARDAPETELADGKTFVALTERGSA